MDIDQPIPYLPIDSPIPFRPTGGSPVAVKTTKTKKNDAALLAAAADELAYITEAREVLDDRISGLKARIVGMMGPSMQAHNELRGNKALWDVRSLPVTTISWRKVAEEVQAPADVVAKHTATRVQVSFKRVPMEVKP